MPARERTLQRMSVALGTLAAIVLGEILLRLGAALSGPRVGGVAATAEVLAPGVAGDCRRQRSQATLAALVRPSRVPDLIYELKPDLDTCFQGVRVRTSADGLRAEASVRRPKPPGVFRVLLLGDSQAFGWGLDEADTLGARLSGELRGPGAPEVEVVNAGVPGYNTAQEAAWLRARGLAYQPDCVMVLYIGNDLGLPTFLLRPQSALLASRSLLLARLSRFFATGMRAEAADPWWETPVLDDQKLLMDGDRPQVPPEYAHLVGVAGYRRALRSLGDTAGAGRLPVVNVADYGVPGVDWDAVHREQEALGIVHVEPRFPWTSPDVRLSEHDPHLSAQAVAELARRVVAELKRRDVCLPPS